MQACSNHSSQFRSTVQSLREDKIFTEHGFPIRLQQILAAFSLLTCVVVNKIQRLICLGCRAASPIMVRAHREGGVHTRGEPSAEQRFQ